MPVSTTDAFFNLDDYLDNMSNNVDVDDLYSAEPLLSEDIWKKFDFAELTGFDFTIIDNLMDDMKPFNVFDELCPIRNHDCMWAGHCGSKEHAADDVRQPNNNHCTTYAPGPEKTPVYKTQQPVPAGRSLLLNKSSIKNYPTQLVHSPESPPMSDDEESKTKQTTTLQLLKDAIAECDIEEDSDLCEYFEDDCCDDDEEEEFGEEDVKRTYFPSETDHCYHKDKTATMRTRSLGIETPSDSEEEIDVVSVNEKFTNRMVCSLPTNPSSQDRRKLQRTVATAISNKRINNGIKTLLPLRKSSIDQSPIKRKTSESRGIKRAKHQQQYRIPTGNNTPYKRRILSSHSSDSEQEPCEKRSLHNNMERQRRIDLRNAFEDLRLLVPAVNQKERAAKVAILREASKYCGELTNASMNKIKQVEDLRRQQERLRARVSQLRRSLASKR